MTKTTEQVAKEAAATMSDAVAALEMFGDSRTTLAATIRAEAIKSLKGHAESLRGVATPRNLTPVPDGAA